MSEAAGRSIVVITLIALVVAGCAPGATISPPVPSDAGPPPDIKTPTNFASPTDLLQRYPSMRRQQL